MENAISQASVEEARNVILQANLTHIEHRLLVDFIEQAASPDLAACEVLKRSRCNTGRPIEETLRDFKKDWHRLVATGRWMDGSELNSMLNEPRTVARSMSDPVHDPTLRDLVYRRDQSRCNSLHRNRHSSYRRLWRASSEMRTVYHAR